MKYRLCDPYRLEGWKGLPTGVYNASTGRTDFLPSEVYRLLLHMDGTEEIQEGLLKTGEKEIIDRLCEKKIIRPCMQDEPLNPEQKYHFYDRTYIAFVHWAVTGKCNYRCRHCYMYAPQAKFPEPTLEDCRKIICSMQDAGVRSIALTGGEPLVREDFLELVDEIIAHGIRIHSIYTNGALVTDRLLNELEKRGQKPEFHISFDGVNHHDWLRGISGAKESALRAMELCRNHGNELYSAMCVHKRNRNEMEETVRFLADRGVVRTRIKFMLPNGMWADQHADESLSIAEATDAAVTFIDKFFADGMPAGVFVDSLFHYDERSRTCSIPYARSCQPGNYLCRKAAMSPFIGPTGVVLPCMTLGGCDFQDRFPNALEIPLSQIMEDSYYHDVTRMTKNSFFEMHEECRNCDARAVCSTGCRACATGNYLNLDKWNCAFLRGGYYRKVDNAIREALRKYHLEDEVRYACISE